MGVAAAALVVSPASADDSVESELRSMRELVLQLQDEVRGQQTKIEEQSDVLREAGLEDRSSGSRLAAFLETTEFSTTIASSYFYNLRSPGSGIIAGGGPVVGAGSNGQNNQVLSNPFHPDHNSIQLDEVWMSMSRAATEESRVGFGLDLVYGALAEINTAIEGGARAAGGNDIWVSQAYLEYLSPFGVTLTAGKFGTHIGYEVAGAANNVMITRGFTYAGLQPVSQIGAKLSGELGPIGLMVGVTNGLGANQTDIDGKKDIIWQVGWGTDMITVLFNGEWGGDAEFFCGTAACAFGQSALVLDGVVEVTPTDALVAWLDVTYAEHENGGVGAKDGDAIGVNVGGRVGVTDRLGLGGRVEWANFDTNFGGTGTPSTEHVGFTSTIDFLIVDGLTFKTEFQYQKVLNVQGAGNTEDLFVDFDGTLAHLDDDQFLIGAQLIYSF